MPRPSFSQLPLNPSDPPYSAWGLYGPDDQLGTLNLLTPDVIKEASKEIQTGVRVGLTLPMDYLLRPSHNRLGIRHEIIHKSPRAVYDDVIEMNTQISSQWDGLRHYGYQDLKKYYNGATCDDIDSSSTLGIQAWCKQGIAGRGVLLDFVRWSKTQNKQFDLISDYAIKASDLQACAQSQNVTFREGDILLIRSGFVEGYNALSDEEKLTWSHEYPTRWVGVETSIDTLKWLWDSGVSAVAGDAPGFERLPLEGKPHLHEVLLSGWGMPIGEYFDLEGLSEECERLGRWSFFFSSMPLNLVGGVGSPPGAMAFF